MNLRPLGPIVALGVLVAAAIWGPPKPHRRSLPDRGHDAAAAADSGATSVPDAGVERTLEVAGTTRSYYFHAPAGAHAALLPLVLVFHGGEGSPAKIAAQTGFTAVADRNGFAVAYPAAIDHWNDGRDTTASFGDDTAFASALIEQLVDSDGIDRNRVYVTGPSNGGMMTLRLACERASEVAAFAVVAGAFPEGYMSRCQPAVPVPIMIIHGSEDRFIRTEGGTIPKGRRAGEGGTVVPQRDTVEFWRKHDGCESQPETTSLPDTTDDGTTAKMTAYPGCASDTEVIFIEIEGGGHTWPGAHKDPVGLLAGRVSRDFDASDIIWDFFRRHTLAERGG
jgi:polyhydroxybutyrate depolymerase